MEDKYKYQPPHWLNSKFNFESTQELINKLVEANKLQTGSYLILELLDNKVLLILNEHDVKPSLVSSNDFTEYSLGEKMKELINIKDIIKYDGNLDLVRPIL